MFDLCVFKMKGEQLITDRNRALNEKQWISCYKERTKMEKGYELNKVTMDYRLSEEDGGKQWSIGMNTDKWEYNTC